MSDFTFNEIKETIRAFQVSLQAHLPGLENEIKGIIENKVLDKNSIENSLDTQIFESSRRMIRFKNLHKKLENREVLIRFATYQLLDSYRQV